MALEQEQSAKVGANATNEKSKGGVRGKSAAASVSMRPPWEADREYQAGQLALLERILACQEQSLHLLSQVERSRAEYTIDALRTEIRSRRKALRFGKQPTPPNTTDLQIQHQQAQIALLKQIRAQQEAYTGLLAGEQREQSALFIGELSRDIQQREQFIQAYKMDSETQENQAEKQLAFLKRLKEQREAELSHLEGPQRELALTVIVRLSDDIDNLERSLATTRTEKDVVASKSDETASSHSLARVEQRWSPKVPFYIPGTNETGTMRLQVSVAEDGSSKHALQFIDDASGISAPRDSIALSREDLGELQRALWKLHSWSTQAQREKIRKIFSKTAACFPLKTCSSPDSGVSALVLFTIYEDGATSGQIQLRKGRYQQPYNFSADSALLLQTYITRTLGAFDRTKRNAALTDKSLHEMFQ